MAKSDPKAENKTVADLRPSAIRVQASVLKTALDQLSAVVEAKPTLPILSHVLIETQTDWFVLTGTDLDIVARLTVVADSDVESRKDWRDFVAAVPAASLRAIAAEVAGEATLVLTLDAERRLVVTAGRARWTLLTLPVEDFPLPDPFVPEAAFEISASVLADTLAAVEFAISNEETRYYLNGIYLHPFALTLRVAATDGHRLSVKGIDGLDGSASFPDRIWPKKTVRLLDKLLAMKAKADADAKGSVDPVLVEAGGHRLAFTIGDALIHSKVIDGQFPEYGRVIPEKNGLASVMVDRQPLMAAIRRVRVLATKESSAISCHLSADKMVLVVKSPETGEAREEVPALATGLIEEPVTLGFNHKYWLEALGAVGSDTVVMFFDGDKAGGAVRIEPFVEGGQDEERNYFVQVLMPMKV